MDSGSGSTIKMLKNSYTLTGITDTFHKRPRSIDFVLEVEVHSYDYKFTAIYPMVGGTAETMKSNVKEFNR